MRRKLDILSGLAYRVGIVNLLLLGTSLAVVAVAIAKGRAVETFGGLACLAACGIRPFVGR